jgi:SAM-dependent methyltransferase
MQLRLLELLACPHCGGALDVSPDSGNSGGSIEDGKLLCVECSRGYPIIKGIPRFVSAENYASSFGYEWHRHSGTQLDSKNATTITKDRFFYESGWPKDLQGDLILEVGAGSGRFTEVALNTGAEVVSVDFSSAIEVALDNNAGNDRLHVVQADLFSLPFKPATFDKVYCLGVIQHTPDPRGAFEALPPFAKPGGDVVFDVYAQERMTRLNPRYVLRPITKRIPNHVLYKMISLAVPVLLPVKSFIRRYVPVIGRYVAGAIPVANYIGVYPLTPEQHIEMSILDTFDALSPFYDSPQSLGEVQSWLDKSGLINTRAWMPYVSLVVGQGVVPSEVR